MNQKRQPTCWIIAGPNGAGKTTFALEYLPRTAGCRVFVNADLIAAGLAPLAPEGRTVAASRVFLREISRNIEAKRDFGFETTLSGLAYRQLIGRLKLAGWRVELIYLALPSVDMAKHRVAERVLHGGHDIPLADIERRFFRSLDNFLSEYVFLADRAVCYCNADGDPVVVFTQRGKRREVAEPRLLRRLEKMRRYGSPG
ncbi:MAG: zeta toxin family protein [Gammaproteobacteria bacterium]|nr:zeta toxin family protein [Gammaproteobacteria bacterium]